MTYRCRTLTGQLLAVRLMHKKLEFLIPLWVGTVVLDLRLDLASVSHKQPAASTAQHQLQVTNMPGMVACCTQAGQPGQPSIRLQDARQRPVAT